MQEVLVPFKGGSVYGRGILRLATKEEHPKFKYIFKNHTGSIFFDSVNDNQVKGIEIIELLTDKKIEDICKK